MLDEKTYRDHIREIAKGNESVREKIYLVEKLVDFAELLQKIKTEKKYRSNARLEISADIWANYSKMFKDHEIITKIIDSHKLDMLIERELSELRKKA